MRLLAITLVVSALLMAANIKVELYPKEVTQLGAQWLINEIPHNSGETISIPDGEYTISFNDISSWKTPSAWKVKAVSGGTTNITASYTKYIPENTQIWRGIDVYSGNTLVRRLTIIANETGRNEYNFQEDVEISPSTIANADAMLERNGHFLEWDECRLAPETNWALIVRNPGGNDAITLKWSQWYVENNTSVIIEKDGGTVCDMSKAVEYTPQETGILRYKISLKQVNKRSREYLLHPGWNTIGLDMIPGLQSMQRLAAYRVYALDEEHGILKEYEPTKECCGVWIYTPRTTSLYLIGEACVPHIPPKNGWSFFCVPAPCEDSAWFWNGKCYEHTTQLIPGQAYWKLTINN